MKSFKKPDEWLDLVSIVQNVADYKSMLTEMFIDKKFTDARWYVLEIYTQDICRNLDQKTSRDILQCYNHYRQEHSIPISQTINKVLQWIQSSFYHWMLKSEHVDKSD